MAQTNNTKAEAVAATISTISQKDLEHLFIWMNGVEVGRVIGQSDKQA